MSDRYQSRSGSQSAHCCFQVTVIDTNKPTIIGGKHYMGSDGQTPQYETICECFEMDDAELICRALNFTQWHED